MSKMKFAVILPAVMVCAAFAVSRWQDHLQSSVPPKGEYPFVSTATLVYDGVNAPALIVSKLCIEFLPVYRITRTPSSFLGIGFEQSFFLVAVVVLWAVAGLRLDRWREKKPIVQRKATRIVLNLVQAALGITLFCLGIIPFGNPGNFTNSFGNIAKGVLFIAWAILLIVSSIIAALRLGYGNDSRQNGPFGSNLL